MRPVFLSCLALALLATPAAAAPIRVTFEMSDQAGFGSNEPRTFSAILPDEPAWQSYRLNSIHVRPPQHGQAEPVSANFRLQLHFDRLIEGPVATGGPSLSFDVEMDGFVTTRPDGGMTPDGAWQGTVLSSDWQWHDSPQIQLPLIEFFRDEVSFSGYVTGGSEGELIASFILPPIPAEYLAEPVPEPSTVAGWGAVGLAALVIRHWRRKSMDKPSAE
ncbi:PEP-CTERM sorting domain-containing protein [Tautonia marina]|uniref:PEP-CTERM sorting domain-containing protein n=1 Tax=Tautonia marina TaxID=2653855 RepID=UPI001260B3E2|nr:PEP-CTERM sorting domain-containing protein [Tautonia marina]